MNLKLGAVVLAAVGLLIGCKAGSDVAGPMDPSALELRFATVKNKTDTRDVPWTIAETNPCNGDAVSGSGLSRFVITTSIDTNGTLRYHSDVSSVGSAVGSPSNKAYKVNQRFTSDVKTTSVTPAFTIREQEIWNVTGPTINDTYKRITTFKIEVDNTGVTKAFVDTSYATCGK